MREEIQFPGMMSGELMSRHTSFRIGGPAEALAKPPDSEALCGLLRLAGEKNWPVHIVGNGTNLLVRDEGVPGLVILTAGLDEIKQTGEDTLQADCGVLLSRLASFAARLGLGGLEFAAGIPGSVGGAVAMNAGAYDGEMKDVVIESVYWDANTTRVLTKEGHIFGYRESFFTHNRQMILLKTTVKLIPRERDEIAAKMDDFARRRRASQPLEWPSAGSVFKRPPGHYAGKLIDECGLRGYTVGGAQVSEKHAGFIINRGGATFRDVKSLITHIQRVVLARTGVTLETEIREIG